VPDRKIHGADWSNRNTEKLRQEFGSKFNNPWIRSVYFHGSTTDWWFSFRQVRKIQSFLNNLVHKLPAQHRC